MDDVFDFFSRTENTVKMLLKQHEINQSHIKKRKDQLLLKHITSGLTSAEKTFGDWWKAYKNDENAIFEAQSQYAIEAFTGGLVAGSVLTIAARAIEDYSKNLATIGDWDQVCRKKSFPIKFFAGRTVYTVPLGLIIYAGWNQHINHVGIEVRQLIREVFLRIATNSDIFEFQAFAEKDYYYRIHLEHFASNVLDVLGWNDYDQYITDMKYLLAR